MSYQNAPLFNQSLGREKIFMEYVEDLDRLSDEGLADVDAVTVAMARLQDWLPKLVLAPSFAVTIIFVYGFIAFAKDSCGAA